MHRYAIAATAISSVSGKIVIDVIPSRFCELTVAPFAWRYAEARIVDVDRYWVQRSRENPHLFNGAVMLLSHWEFSDGGFRGRYFETEFARFLYWQKQLSDGSADVDRSVRNCCGAALLRGADGGLLLGRAAAHTANAGIAYPLSGFVDPQDIVANDQVDPERNITREMAEEVGFEATAFTLTAGYVMACGDESIQFGIEYRSAVSSAELRRQALFNLSKQAVPELSDVIVVRSLADLRGLLASDHTEAFVRYLFGEDRG